MKFSIIIASKNEEKYIGRAISSILMQGVDFEIFINDVSTDNTRKIIDAYRSFLGDRIIMYERPEGEHIHDTGRKILDMATGDVWHAMSAHTHFMEGTLKYVQENIKDCLFGAVQHEDGTIQLPLNPEDMSSYAMFFSIPFLRKNNLTYEEKYPDIADYVLRKRVWNMGAAIITDRILTMPSPRISQFTKNNLNERNIQQQFFKEELLINDDIKYTRLVDGNFRPYYEK